MLSEDLDVEIKTDKPKFTKSVDCNGHESSYDRRILQIQIKIQHRQRIAICIVTYMYLQQFITK